MSAREEVLAKTEAGATATAAATATATATAAGAVSWSFASPTATPPPRSSSTASMIVVPGSGMDVVQRYEYTGRELASESSGYYFFRFRVYGPELGQFVTRGPLGYVDGMGLYIGRFGVKIAVDPYGQSSNGIIVNGTAWPLIVIGNVTVCAEFDYKMFTPALLGRGWSTEKLGMNDAAGVVGRDGLSFLRVHGGWALTLTTGGAFTRARVGVV